MGAMSDIPGGRIPSASDAVQTGRKMADRILRYSQQNAAIGYHGFPAVKASWWRRLLRRLGR